MIHVYTGNGKGKTTAALGLALRACGAGLKVFVCQFVKGRHYSELKSLKKLKNIKIRQFGRSCFIKTSPKESDKRLAMEGFFLVKKIILEKNFDLVVLDEINIAIKLGLLDLNEVLNLLDLVDRDTEVVLTGRYAPDQIIKKADLVSEIKEKKHYYRNGVKARRGIEF